ncbi:MAG: hypothetical protein HY816_02065 [Candidatus Wallbacteria bacterium]|nr:hypothetical protein [Candidatus Wallbacteria bacterium]
MQTYHGIHIPRATADSVLDALDNFFFHRYFTRRGKALATDTVWNVALSDERDGWVSVYDEGENFRRANLLARSISSHLHRPALWTGLWEGQDFYYQLFNDGEPIDAYDSDPSIFDADEGFTDDPEGTGWLPADFSGLNRDRNIAGLGDPTAFFSVIRFADEADPGRLQSLLSRGRAYHGEGLPEHEELDWASEGIRGVAELVGVAPERMLAGYDSLLESSEPPAWLKLLEYRRVARADGAEPPRRRKGKAE